MKPAENRSVVFESHAELDVLSAGLEVILDNAPQGPVHKQATVMRQFTRDIPHVSERLMSEPLLGDTAPTGVSLTFEDPEHTMIAELAVRLVAANEPGTTPHESLQDPLVHGEAIEMWAGYLAAGGPQFPQPE